MLQASVKQRDIVAVHVLVFGQSWLSRNLLICRASVADFGVYVTSSASGLDPLIASNEPLRHTVCV